MNSDITTAWYVAGLSRQERLPALRSLLIGEPERHSRDEQRRAWLQIAEKHGMRVRKVVH